MVNTAVVKSSTIGALRGTPLNPEYLIKVSEKLAEYSLEETPDNARETEARMRYEALDLMASARRARADAAAHTELARIAEREAEMLTNSNRQALNRGPCR